MADRRAAVHRAWLAAGWLMVVGVTWGSLTPMPPHIEFPFPQFDKLEHFSAYFLMTAWFAAVWPKHWTWVALGFIVMGGLIEILQGLSGWRDAEWLDWAADCAGVALALWYPMRWLSSLRNRLMTVS